MDAQADADGSVIVPLSPSRNQIRRVAFDLSGARGGTAQQSAHSGGSQQALVVDIASSPWRTMNSLWSGRESIEANSTNSAQRSPASYPQGTPVAAYLQPQQQQQPRHHVVVSADADDAKWEAAECRVAQSKLQEEVNLLRKENRELTRQLRDQAEKVESVETLRVEGIHKAEERARQQERVVEELRAEKEAEERRNKQLHEELQSRKEELLHVQKTLSEERETQNDIMLQNEKLRAMARKASEQQKKVDQSSSEQSKELAAVNMQRMKLERQVGELTTEMERMKASHVAASEEALEKYRQQAKQLSASQARCKALASAEERCATLGQELKVGQQQLNCALDDQKQAEAESLLLRASLKELEVKLASVEKEREEKMSQRMGETELKLRELSAHMEGETLEHTAQLSKKQSVIEEISKKLLDHGVELTKARNDLEQKMALLSNVSSENRSLLCRVAVLEESLKNRSAQADELRAQLHDAQVALGSERGRAEALQKSLQDSEAALQSQMQRANSVGDSAASRAAEVTNLALELKRWKEEADSKQRQIAELQSRLQIGERRFEELSKDAQSTHDECERTKRLLETVRGDHASEVRLLQQKLQTSQAESAKTLDAAPSGEREEDCQHDSRDRSAPQADGSSEGAGERRARPPSRKREDGRPEAYWLARGKARERAVSCQRCSRGILARSKNGMGARTARLENSSWQLPLLN